MRLDLCLTDEGNDFQQDLRSQALAVAAKHGAELRVTFTGEELSGHLAALRAIVQRPEARPDAVIVMALRDRGLQRLAGQAADAGIHWLFLNRTEDELDAVRRAHPQVVVSVVCVDELEIGRIQGRQVMALLPRGGKVLCVTGSLRSLTAQQRLEGLQEATAGSLVEVMQCGGEWQPEAARQAVRDWFRMMGRSRVPVDLVACQNDHMAGGALRGLTEAALELRRPELGRVPVLGCDGLPGVGQKMVREGQLIATVVLPALAAHAVEAIAGFLQGGPRPAPQTSLPSAPFPGYEELKPLAGNRS